jgi:hypothetical protein
LVSEEVTKKGRNIYLVTSASAAKARAVRERMRKEGRMVMLEIGYVLG